MDGPDWAADLIRFGNLAELGWARDLFGLGNLVGLVWFGHLVMLEIFGVGDMAVLDIGLSLTFGWVGDWIGCG